MGSTRHGKAGPAGSIRHPHVIRLLLSSITLTLLYCLAASYFISSNAEAELEVLQARDMAAVETAAGMLVHRLEMVEADTRFLANAPAVQAWLSGQEGALAQVEELLLAFAGARHEYAHLTLHDAAGHEVARINRRETGVQRVSPARLQDKSDRYYWAPTARLESDQVYRSPLDLNVEDGRVEIPYRPALRSATPLHDASDRLGGILVLNLDATDMLARFRELMSSTGDAMLLNHDGDWLVGPRDQEWGFMFGNPEAFARRYPEAWRQLQQSPRGQQWTDDGLLLHATLSPLSLHQHAATGAPLAGASEEESEYVWTAASLIPHHALPSRGLLATPLRGGLFLGGLGVVLVANLVTLYLLAQRRQARQLSLREAHRHEQITANLAEGLLVMDRQGRIVETNPEAERLLGWRRAELLGHDAHRTVHQPPGAADDPGDECHIQARTLAGEHYRSDRERFYRRDGESLPINISAAPLRDNDTVIGAVVAFHDITERLDQEAAIRRLAYHDTLTGLPNRRQLMDRLEQAVAAHHRHGRRLALAFLDLDHFKEVNDNLGHEAGDALLVAVAERLTRVTRENDLVCRQGGDEFVVLLDGIASCAEAELTAAKLIEALQRPVEIGEHRILPGVSLGIALLPDHGEDADSLMKAADAAMYRAKQAGRNGYRLAGPR